MRPAAAVDIDRTDRETICNSKSNLKVRTDHNYPNRGSFVAFDGIIAECHTLLVTLDKVM